MFFRFSEMHWGISEMQREMLIVLRENALVIYSSGDFDRNANRAEGECS
jgi:hypothetical protein